MMKKSVNIASSKYIRQNWHHMFFGIGILFYQAPPLFLRRVK